MAQETIKGNDILMVQCISEELAYKVDKESPMFGKKYRRYNYSGKVFITNDKNFYTELEAGGVESLKLDVNDEGLLSMVGFVTYKKLIGQKRNQVQLEAISVDDFKTTPLITTKAVDDIPIN